MKTNIILASLLALISYWHAGSEHLQERRLNELKTLQETLAADRLLIETENEYALRRLIWNLDVDQKAKYKPILPMITETKKIVDEFTQKADAYLKHHRKKKLSDDDLQSLEILAERQLFGIETNVALSLKTFSREFGISENQLDQVLKNSDCARGIRTLRSILQDRASGLDSVSTSVRLMVLNQHFARIASEMTNFYASLAGGKTISCYFGLPFGVYAINQPSRVGDSVGILFVVSGYSPERDNIRFKLNGKPFVPDAHGVIEYNGFYNAYQPHINVEYEIVNPLTGEVYAGDWQYHFELDH